ncbi:MAG: hypothetical protein ABFC98_08730 [Candidatus Cloacimonas sp.]
MKVSFKYGLAGYTGKTDGLVYCYNRHTGKVYARHKSNPRLTKENERIGKMSKNIFGLKPSAAYKDDLQLYCMRYNGLRNNQEKRIGSWVNLYVILMTNMAKAMPNINLNTITRAEIYQNDLPCQNIKKAVEAGILSPVEGYERLTALL